jgi:hypothetical protein
VKVSASWPQEQHPVPEAISAIAASPARTELGAWWQRAPELFEEMQFGRPRFTWGGSYRLGDAALDIDADDRSFAESLREQFAECEVSEGAHLPRVRCTLRTRPDELLACLDVEAAVPIDAVEIVCSLLEPRPGKNCTVGSSPREGWRLVARNGSLEPLAAIAGRRAVLRTDALRPNFFCDFAASLAMRSQTGVLFLHGASLCIGGAGVLLTGRGGAGKTTLALALASRGHGLLGDDLAALRLEALELLPVRRTLYIRRGLRAARVEQVLRERRVEMEILADAKARAVVQARELFPADPVQLQPAALRSALFLRAFRKRPAVERFAPSLAQMETLRDLPLRLQWGITPALRLLRFAQAVRALTRVPCYFLDVGQPDETADLIEKIAEES